MWDSLEKFVLLQKLKEALESLKSEGPDDVSADRHHILTTLNALITDSSDWLVLDTQYIPVTANLPPDALKPLVSTPWKQPQTLSPPSPTTEDTPPQETQHATPKAKKPSTRGKKKGLEEPNAADTPSKVVAPSPSPRKTTGPKYSTSSLVVLHNVVTSAFALPHEFPVYSLEGCLHWLTSDKTTTPLDPGYVYAKWIEATKEEKEGAKEEGQLVKAIDELVRAKLGAVDRILIGIAEDFPF